MCIYIYIYMVTPPPHDLPPPFFVMYHPQKAPQIPVLLLFSETQISTQNCVTKSVVGSLTRQTSNKAEQQIAKSVYPRQSLRDIRLNGVLV